MEVEQGKGSGMGRLRREREGSEEKGELEK